MPVSASGAWRHLRHSLGALAVLAALAVHARTALYGFTDLDDRDLIVDDHAFLVRLTSRPAGLVEAFTRPYMHVIDAHHAYYRPLVTLSYAADAAWSGLRPLGYHCTNVALHAVASALLALLLRGLGMERAVATIAATLFAVHPVMASAVAWIPGRNDSLLAVLALAAWLGFTRDQRQPSWPHRCAHLVFFSLALFTKETAIAIPLVCLAQAALVPSLRDDARSNGFRWPTLVGGWLLAIAARAIAFPHAGEASLSQAATHAAVLLGGLGKVLLPVNASLIAAEGDLPIWPGAVAVLAVLAAVRLLPRARRRVVALGISAFVLLLAPSLAVPGTLLLEDRLYLPACGFFIAAAEIANGAVRGGLDTRTLSAFSAAAALGLAALTCAYDESFRDRAAFARSAATASPHCGLAHFCLGQSYQIEGDTDRAIAEYELALKLGATAVVHNNIAVAHMRDARWVDAEEELRKELAIDPDYGRAYYNLAVVLRRLGRLDEARAAEDRALQLSPDDVGAVRVRATRAGEWPP